MADQGTPAQREAVDKIVACNETDYYAILGVPKDASTADITKAYRKLSLSCHPDKNNLPCANDAFVLVNKANEVLSNEEQRAVHDNPPSGQPRPGGSGSQPPRQESRPFDYGYPPSRHRSPRPTPTHRSSPRRTSPPRSSHGHRQHQRRPTNRPPPRSRSRPAQSSSSRVRSPPPRSRSRPRSYQARPSRPRSPPPVSRSRQRFYQGFPQESYLQPQSRGSSLRFPAEPEHTRRWRPGYDSYAPEDRRSGASSPTWRMRPSFDNNVPEDQRGGSSGPRYRSPPRPPLSRNPFRSETQPRAGPEYSSRRETGVVAMIEDLGPPRRRRELPAWVEEADYDQFTQRFGARAEAGYDFDANWELTCEDMQNVYEARSRRGFGGRARSRSGGSGLRAEYVERPASRREARSRSRGPERRADYGEGSSSKREAGSCSRGPEITVEVPEDLEVDISEELRWFGFY